MIHQSKKWAQFQNNSFKKNSHEFHEVWKIKICKVYYSLSKFLRLL